MIASYDKKCLLCFITIEAGKGCYDQFVAPADFYLVEGEQLIIAVCFLWLEFIEDAIGYKYCLWVVNLQCS